MSAQPPKPPKPPTILSDFESKTAEKQPLAELPKKPVSEMTEEELKAERAALNQKIMESHNTQAELDKAISDKKWEHNRCYCEKGDLLKKLEREQKKIAEPVGQIEPALKSLYTKFPLLKKYEDVDSTKVKEVDEMLKELKEKENCDPDLANDILVAHIKAKLYQKQLVVYYERVKDIKRKLEGLPLKSISDQLDELQQQLSKVKQEFNADCVRDDEILEELTRRESAKAGAGEAPTSKI